MINQLIKDLAKGDSPYNSVLCTVKEVSESDRTIDVLPIDGSAEIFGVRLNALLETEETDKGEYNIPAINSFVLVTFLDNANAYVSGFSVIEKKIGKIGKIDYSFTKDNGIDIKVDTNKAIITIANNGQIDIKSNADVIFNNGGNGGMAIAGQIATYFNELYTKLNNHILAYNAHIHVLTGSTIAPTVAQATAPTAPPAIENSKVKH